MQLQCYWEKMKGCNFLPHSVEWFGYSMVKNNFEDMLTRFDRITNCHCRIIEHYAKSHC